MNALESRYNGWVSVDVQQLPDTVMQSYEDRIYAGDSDAVNELMACNVPGMRNRIITRLYATRKHRPLAATLWNHKIRTMGDANELLAAMNGRECGLDFIVNMWRHRTHSVTHETLWMLSGCLSELGYEPDLDSRLSGLTAILESIKDLTRESIELELGFNYEPAVCIAQFTPKNAEELNLLDALDFKLRSLQLKKIGLSYTGKRIDEETIKDSTAVAWFNGEPCNTIGGLLDKLSECDTNCVVLKDPSAANTVLRGLRLCSGDAYLFCLTGELPVDNDVPSRIHQFNYIRPDGVPVATAVVNASLYVRYLTA